MTTDEYPIGGFAPGNYSNRCANCGNKFMGDKLARQCFPCAKKMIEEEKPNIMHDYSIINSKTTNND